MVVIGEIIWCWLMTKKCDHVFDLVEKHIDSDGNQVWEFYCKQCLEIRIMVQKSNTRTELIKCKNQNQKTIS